MEYATNILNSTFEVTGLIVCIALLVVIFVKKLTKTNLQRAIIFHIAIQVMTGFLTMPLAISVRVYEHRWVFSLQACQFFQLIVNFYWATKGMTVLAVCVFAFIEYQNRSSAKSGGQAIRNQPTNENETENGATLDTQESTNENQATSVNQPMIIENQPMMKTIITVITISGISMIYGAIKSGMSTLYRIEGPYATCATPPEFAIELIGMIVTILCGVLSGLASVVITIILTVLRHKARLPYQVESLIFASTMLILCLPILIIASISPPLLSFTLLEAFTILRVLAALELLLTPILLLALPTVYNTALKQLVCGRSWRLDTPVVRYTSNVAGNV